MSSVAAFLARQSAISFPCIPTCAFTQLKKHCPLLVLQPLYFFPYIPYYYIVFVSILQCVQCPKHTHPTIQCHIREQHTQKHSVTSTLNNSVTSENNTPNNIVSHPRTTHPTKQCHIPEQHAQNTVLHPRTTHPTTVSYPRTTYPTSQCHIPEQHTNNTMSHPRTTCTKTQCHIPEQHIQQHSVTSQNNTPNNTVLHPRTTHPTSQCHITEHLNPTTHCMFTDYTCY